MVIIMEEKLKSIQKQAKEAKDAVVEAVKAANESPSVKKAKKAVKDVSKEVSKEIKPIVEEATKEVKKAAKKATSKEIKSSVHVQFSGKSYSTEELVKIAKDVWKYDLKKKVGDFKSVELYVKPEENQCYYVINGEVTGQFFI